MYIYYIYIYSICYIHAYIHPRWYRAPECLLRDRTYSSPARTLADLAVDVVLLTSLADVDV